MKKSFSVQFLGTGTSTGVPMIACQCEVCTSADSHNKRLRSSVLVTVDDTTILIDTSPDLRQQFLRSDITNVDAILVTHSHKDHLSGLDDIRAINHAQKKRIPLYTNSNTIAAIHRDFYYAFETNRYPGLFEVDLIEVQQEPFFINNIKVIPIHVLHGKMDVLGFRINNFTYITDASCIPVCELEKIKNSEVLVINALRHTEHHSHFTLPQAIAIAQELVIPKVYFTHISHQMGLHTNVSKTLPPNMHLAYDGLSLTINA